MGQLENLMELQNKINSGKLMPDTEETTKQWFILPLFQILGYDIFSENVISEYSADFGEKKGERVDYCLKRFNNENIIVECKDASVKLNNIHIRQLALYYHNLSAKNEKPEFAILTNGIEYQIFREAQANIMADKTFLTINLATDDSFQLQKMLQFAFRDAKSALLEAIDKADNFDELNSAIEAVEEYYDNVDNKDVRHQISGIVARIEWYRDLMESTYYLGELIDGDFRKLKIVMHNYVEVVSKIAKMQEKDINCKKLGVYMNSTDLNVGADTVITGVVVNNKIRVDIDSERDIVNRIKLTHGREESSNEFIHEYLDRIDAAENYMEKELKWMMPDFAPKDYVQKHGKLIKDTLLITIENIVNIERELIEYEKII